MVPYERATDLIRDLFLHTISAGTLVSWVGKTYDALESSDVTAVKMLSGIVDKLRQDYLAAMITGLLGEV